MWRPTFRKSARSTLATALGALVLLTATALALLAAGSASPARAGTVEMSITDITAGATSGVIVGTPTVYGSTVDFNGTVGAWNAADALGFSVNLGGAVALELVPFIRTFNTTDTLHIVLSDNGFTTPTASINLALAGTLDLCSVGTCTVTIKNFFSTTNALFAETTQVDGDFISTATFLTQNVTVAGPPTTPYSLTIDMTFTETQASPAGPVWSTVSNINNGVNLVFTPVPTALPLFASGLVGLVLLAWRRKRKASAA